MAEYEDESQQIDLSQKHSEKGDEYFADDNQDEEQIQYHSKFDRQFFENLQSKPKSPNYNYYIYNDDLPTYRSSLKFPANREIYEYVQDFNMLKQLVQSQLKTSKLLLDIQYHQTPPAKYNRSFYVVCHSCTRKLLMKHTLHLQSNDNNQTEISERVRYKLMHFDNTHTHESDRSLMLKKDFKFDIFLLQYNEHKDMTLDQFYRYLAHKYHITQKQYRYFLSNIQQKRDQQMKSLLQNLQKNKSRLWMIQKLNKQFIGDCQEFDFKKNYVKDPQFFMYSLPFMVQNCANFSRICYINIISGFVQNKTKNGKKCWEIITFCGLTHFNDLAPFAIAFLDTLEHSIQNLSLIIKKFFDQFKVTPQIIITPYSPFFKQLIQNVKRQAVEIALHLYDGICYLQTIGVSLDNISDRKHYQSIVLSRTKQQFRIRCQQLFQRVPPTPKNMMAFNKLLEVAPKMCFSQIDTDRFIGLIFRFSGNRHFLNFLRQIFTKGKVKRYEQRIEQIYGEIVRKKWKNSEPTLIKSVFLITRTIIRYHYVINHIIAKKAGYCQWRSQSYLELFQYENIRMCIKKQFLDLILHEYGKIFQMQATKRQLKDPQRPEMKIFDVYDKMLQAVFVVAAQPEYTKTLEFKKFAWRCNCLYSFKSGLPCGHEIKVALITQTSNFDQIHDMWLKTRQYPANMKRRGRNKGTRRNTEK